MRNNNWGKELTKWLVNTMIKNVDGNKEDIKWRYGSMEKWTYVCVECVYMECLYKNVLVKFWSKKFNKKFCNNLKIKPNSIIWNRKAF